VRGLGRNAWSKGKQDAVSAASSPEFYCAEKLLWKYLRSRALNSFKFVRQEPMGPYVVDFACRQRRLVIEVDGGQHADNKRDLIRDRWLTDHRYRVLRFWNNEVLENIEGVWETILSAASAERPLTLTLSP
jgi:very-short-patch-repair endonuclease